jgi:hypothetical protein
MNELTDDNMWCAAHDFVTPDADGQCPECARYEDDDLPCTCWRSYKHDGWPHFDGVDEAAIPRIYNPECPEHGQGITE